MPSIHKAVWLHRLPSTKHECVEIVDNLARARIELLVACVKYMDGLVEYPSKIARIRPGLEKFDPLTELCQLTSQHGIKLHAWFCVFTEGTTSPLVLKYPAVKALTPEGKTVAPHGISNTLWVCPRRPEVQEYELSLFKEVMTNYPVSGVHLDYIRYHNRSVCYCGVCRNSFHKEFGKDISLMTREFDDEVYVPALAWRADPVTKFVENLRKETHLLHKELSAAVFTAYPSCYSGEGQDWRKWCENMLVDYICPMTYCPAPVQVDTYTRLHRALVSKPVLLWEGILRYKWATSAQFIELVQTAINAGADGIVVFQYSALSPEDISMLAHL
jgi:uncharacterized lipoprotein YddW (UPF0748 family)